MPTFTRAYLTRRAHGTIQPGPHLGDVDEHESGPRLNSPVVACYVLSDTKVNGGELGNLTVGEENDIDGYTILFARWKTDLLTAQTISGTIDLCALVGRTNAAATAVWKVYAAVTVGDTNTLRGVLLNNYEDSTLWTLTGTARSFAAPQAMASVGALDGDRVLVEISVCFASNAPAAFETIAQMRIGSTVFPTGPVADQTPGSTILNRAPWVDFSNAITTVAAPAAPGNDACVDAIVIPSLPYDSGVIDSTQAAEAEKDLYWTWTAPSDMRVIVTSLGGNYGARLRVYTGGCGALALISGTNRAEDQWIQQSQTITQFTATSGVQYWIRHSDNYLGTAGGAARLHVYERQAPAFDDLFVDAQHIVSYREDLVVNATPDFYGDTPTGNAVDTSLAPMDDLNGGTHSDLRLYVALFGSPIVEILDLATLNYLTSEVDYILDPLVGGSTNLGSIIFDDSQNALMGFFGDNYDYLGVTATPPTGDVRELPATHADTQAGAPWPAPTQYAVDYENGGSDYIDLASDQETIWYTSAGQTIKRFNRATNTQLADFVTLPVLPGARPGLRTLRLLPPGDGSAGLLVTSGAAVYRLDASGTIITTYTPASGVQDLDKVEITSDHLHFWASDQLTCTLHKFNIASGAEELVVITDLPVGQLSGFTIYNGYRPGDSETNGNGNGNGGEPEPEPGLPTTIRDIPIRRQRRAPFLTHEQLWNFFASFQLDLKTGVGLDVASCNAQGGDPMIMLRWSDDGGHTWSDEYWVSAGKIGQHRRRAIWRRLGRSRKRIFEVTVSDPVPWQLIGAYLDIEPERS